MDIAFGGLRRTRWNIRVIAEPRRLAWYTPSVVGFYQCNRSLFEGDDSIGIGIAKRAIELHATSRIVNARARQNDLPALRWLDQRDR